MAFLTDERKDMMAIQGPKNSVAANMQKNAADANKQTKKPTNPEELILRNSEMPNFEDDDWTYIRTI